MLNEMHSTIIILKKGGTPIIVKIPQTNANTSKMKYNSFILKKKKKALLNLCTLQLYVLRSAILL